jgi:hypothetical protein
MIFSFTDIHQIPFDVFINFQLKKIFVVHFSDRNMEKDSMETNPMTQCQSTSFVKDVEILQQLIFSHHTEDNNNSNEAKIDEICQKYPNENYFYDANHHSIAANALKNKKLDLYRHFMENAKFIGPNESFYEFYKALNADEKEEMKQINKQHNFHHFEEILWLKDRKFQHDFKNNNATVPLSTYLHSIHQLHRLIQSDFPIIKLKDKIDEIRLNYPELTHFYDNKNVSLAAMALKNDKFSIFELLVDCKINMGPDEDFPNSYLSDLNELKRQIKLDNDESLSMVKKIRDNYPKLKYFYDAKSLSIAGYALKSKKTPIYEFLVKNKVFVGPKEDLDEIYKSLDSDGKKEMMKINRENEVNLPNHHLTVLLSRSKCSHDEVDEENAEELFRFAYKTLNEIEATKSIMQVVAAYEKCEIIFDFNRDHTQMLAYDTDKTKRGEVDLRGMTIIAGVKELRSVKFEDKMKAVGTLGHELCHAAMQIIYRNGANPYARGDVENMAKFEEIFKICRKENFKENIIVRVFQYKSSSFHKELIVRVPHMLAHYHKQDEKLLKLKEEFGQLFNYFNTISMPTLIASITMVKKLTEDPENVSWSDLTDAYKTTLMNSIINFHGLEQTFHVLELEKSFGAIKTKKQIDDIMTRRFEINDRIEDTNFYFRRFFQVKKYREDKMNEFLVAKINKLDEKVGIEEDDFELRDIIKQIKFREISKNVFHIIKAKLKCRSEIVEFINSGREEMQNREIDYKEFCLPDNKVILLSDSAGAGKTTTFRNCARLLQKLNTHKNKWVSYVDLKQQVNVFDEMKKLESDDKNETKCKYFLKKILKLKEPLKCDIFDEIFNKHGIVIFWDGVDEISPNFKDQVIELIANFNDFYGKKCQQWVSTRIEFEEELSQHFNVNVYKLAPLKADKQMKFLRTYATRVKKIDEKESDNFMSKCMKLKDMIEYDPEREDESSNNLDNPLILTMIADADLHKIDFHSKDSLDAFNLASLYQNFIEKKFMELPDDKGDVVKDDHRKIIAGMNSVNLWEIHQYYAIKQNNQEKDFQINILNRDITWDVNQIYRYGLIRPNQNSLSGVEFIHATFGEFFIANYTFEKIICCDENLNETEYFDRLKLLLNTALNGTQVMRDFILNFANSTHKKSFLSKTIFKNLNLIMFDFLKIYFHFEMALQPAISFLSKILRNNREMLERFWCLNENETLFHKLCKYYLNNDKSSYFDVCRQLKLLVQETFPNIEQQTKILHGKHQRMNIAWSFFRYKHLIFGNLPNEMKVLMNLELEENFFERNLFPYDDFSNEEKGEFYLKNFSAIYCKILGILKDESCKEFLKNFKNVLPTHPKDRSSLQILGRNDNLFHYLSDLDPANFTMLLQKIRKHFDEQSIRLALKVQNGSFMTPLMCIAFSCKNVKVYKLFLKFLRKIFTDKNEMRTHLLDQYRSSLAALQRAALNNNVKIFQLTLTLYEEYLDASEIQEIFLQKPSFTQELFFAEFLKNSSPNTSANESLQRKKIAFFTKYFEDLFDNEMLMKFLLLSNMYSIFMTKFTDEQLNFLHPLVKRVVDDETIDKTRFLTQIFISTSCYIPKFPNENFDWKKHFEWLKNQFEIHPNLRDEIYSENQVLFDIFFMRSYEISDAHAADYSLQFFALFFDKPNVKKSMRIVDEDLEVMPLIDAARECKNVEILEILYKFIKQNTSGRDELKDILLERDLSSSTALHSAILNKNINIYKFVAKIYEEYLTEGEIQDIFINKNVEFNSLVTLVLERLIKFSPPENVTFQIEYFGNLFKNDNEKLKKFLLLKGGTCYDGVTVFTRYCDGKQIALIPLMKQILSDDHIDNTDFILDVFITSPSFLTVSSNDFFNWEKNFAFLQEKFANHPDLIISKLNELRNWYFQNFYKINYVKAATFSLKLMEIVFDAKDIQTSMRTKKNPAEFLTPLMYCAQFSQNPKILTLFCDCMQRVFIAKNELKEYLLETDNKLWRALFHCLKNPKFNAFQILLKIYEENFDESEIPGILIDERIRISDESRKTIIDRWLKYTSFKKE